MSTMIGVLVHSQHQERLRESARSPADVALRWATYREPPQVPDSLRELLAAEPAGLLLDAQATDTARELLPDWLPVGTLRPTTADLALAFARMRALFPQHHTASVDGFTQAEVDEIARALDLTATAADGPVSELVARHREALRGGAVTFTARPEVDEELGADAAVIALEPTAGAIRAALRELLSQVDVWHAEGLRTAVGLFQVRDGDDSARSRAGLREILLRDPALSGAWVENHGRRGLIVFAHQALLERATQAWRAVPALQDAQRELGVRAAAGFGIGTSVRAGASLAERALVRAAAEEQPCGFLVQDSGTIIGPIGGGHRTRYSYRDHGAALERLAAEAGLSATTLSRLVALEREVRGRALAPSDLAALLGITDPSGRRLIRKLQAADLVTSEGSAHATRRGRPTRLYRLRLTDMLDSSA
ncbi:hypothetical protein [Saccharopolyspora griseoalba]|uniref:Transcriptional regulator n=1 Tax=Saccharopolyspora griseoalba TaxID=1431848 RepID=A0ABW2LD93_9PSEU